MPEVSATDASRRFSDLLDGVEHRGERYVIVRRGRIVAQLEPAGVPFGSDVKEFLLGHALDAGWSEEVDDLRRTVVSEGRE